MIVGKEPCHSNTDCIALGIEMIRYGEYVMECGGTCESVSRKLSAIATPVASHQK